MSYYIEKLQQVKSDEYQNKAYISNNNTVVIAGPGSGKTTILTLKIMQLLIKKIKEPRGLACLTFNNETVREFKNRLKLMGYIDRKNVFLGTVHSFCIQEILNIFGSLYLKNVSFPIKIISQKEKKLLFNNIKNQLGYSQDKFKVLDMDKVRNLNIKGKSKFGIQSDEKLLKISEKYDETILKNGYMDYESIIKFSIELIQEKEYVRKCLNAKFPWILIDEYQDLGKPLHEMILSLFENTNIKIFAVGDPDQSIYAFSGAYPNYLLELKEKEKFTVVELKNNYRSAQDIIDGSEIVLNQKRNYKSANSAKEKAEYHFVTVEEDLTCQYEATVKRIIPYYIQKKIHLEEISVLVATNDNARELGTYCLNNKIPYYISKNKFDRTDFIKWLEDIAIWLSGDNYNFEEIYSFYENLYIRKFKLEFLTENKMIKLKKNLYYTLKNSIVEKNNLKKWLEYIIKNNNITELLSESDLYPDELDNIQILLDEISEDKYNDYDLTKFSKIGKPENQITISTRHSSKGLEFEVVIMLGMEDDNFPGYYKKNNPEELAEENRLCFVCVSRAKSACILVRSKINNIPTKDGRIWRKSMDPSRYWVQLYDKYSPKKLNNKD